MADFDPADLDISEIRARLNAISRSQFGLEPRNPLPIDKYVTNLSSRPRAPKLRPAHDLAEFHERGCPYLIAREGVSHAAFHAHFRTFANDHRVAANKGLSILAEVAPKAIVQLREMLVPLQTVIDAQEYDFDPDVERLSLLETGDHLLNALSAIERLQRPAVDIYRRRSQGNGNVWRIRFAGAMFRPWWVLTSRDPSTTDPFYGFLDAAWHSLSDRALPELDWESAILTAKARLRGEHGVAAPWQIEPDAGAAGEAGQETEGRI